MGLYFVVFIFAFLANFKLMFTNNRTVVTYKNKRFSEDDVYYGLLAVALFVMIIFCYDRSGDYYTYMGIYNAAPKTIDFSSIYYMDKFHTEFGWKFLCNLGVVVGLPFEGFIGIISGIEFILLIKFINRDCYTNKSFSLLWIYSSFYLVYLYIGIRNGLVICIYLVVLQNFLQTKQWKKYVFGVLLCALIHSVALFLLLVPLLELVSIKTLHICLAIAMIFGVSVFWFEGFPRIIALLPSIIQRHITAEVTNAKTIVQILYRLIFVISVCFAWRGIQHNVRNERHYKIFLLGAIAYFFTLGIPVLGVRLFDLLRVVEITIISKYIDEGKRRNREIFFLAMMGAITVMYFYHVGGAYFSIYPEFYKHFNKINFPYVSVFNKRSLREFIR